MISQNEKDLLKITEYYKVLADPLRLRILKYIVSSGNGEIKCSELAEKTGLPAASVNRHLKMLKETGLLSSRTEERTQLYSADRQSLREMKYLTDSLYRDLEL